MAEADDDDLDALRLTRLWEARWPGCEPVGHELRGCASDRWVRFHSLPGSKRYPDTEDEHAEVLRRHHVVIDDLLGHDPASTGLTVVVGAWSDTDHERPDDPRGTIPCGYWRSIPTDGDPDLGWLDLFVTHLTPRSAGLDTLLRRVAEDSWHSVIIGDATFSRLYHPYDGGADVIASTPGERDRLATAHHAWLSGHPHGL